MPRTDYSSYCYRFIVGAALLFSFGCMHRVTAPMRVSLVSGTPFSSAASRFLTHELQQQAIGAQISPGKLTTKIVSSQVRNEWFASDVDTVHVTLKVLVTYTFDDGHPPFTHTFTHTHTHDVPDGESEQKRARELAIEQCSAQLATRIIFELEQL